MLKLIECPRDAMQGITAPISTGLKVGYLNQLLKVGFDTIDFGSFVSPKAIPQMADTAEVMGQLDLSTSRSKLLAIIANVRGAQDAVQFDGITYLGFPFSISETFQQRNTNSTIAESLDRVKEIQEICVKNDKTLVVYISMGFGNPYGDPWDFDVAAHWVDKMAGLGISINSLADTVGVATPDKISYLFDHLVPEFPNVEIGAHLHSAPHNWEEKVTAAWQSGCRRFDGALKGYGGCPMAEDELVGNLATENLISFMEKKDAKLELDKEALSEAMAMAANVFDRD